MWGIFDATTIGVFLRAPSGAKNVENRWSEYIKAMKQAVVIFPEMSFHKPVDEFMRRL
jgi:hypothetical protein